MATNYPYTISTAFPNGKVNGDVLAETIHAVILGSVLDHIDSNVVPDQCDIWFVTPLSPGDQATLSAVVASHQGYGYTATMKGTVPILDVVITEDATWQVLGGVVTTPNFFTSDLNQILGRIVGQIKGDGGQIRIMEEVEGQPDRELTIPAWNAPNTVGLWAPFKVDTNQPPSDAVRNLYRIEARRNGAAAMQLRFSTISLLVIEIY